VVGFRAGVLFGHASCLDLELMQMVSQFLKIFAQRSTALDQALHVLAGAANKRKLQNEVANAAEKKEEEKANDDKQADGSPDQVNAPNAGQADASPGNTAPSKPADAAIKI
jgi:hypothetical protein